MSASSSSSSIEIAIALIQDNLGRILITQRSLSSTQPGLWEFPGGKIEKDEPPLSALKREVLEEVGLHVCDAEYVNTMQHRYGLKDFNFYIYWVRKFTGDAFCREAQMAMRWVKVKDLKHYKFPEANKKILNSISPIGSLLP